VSLAASFLEKILAILLCSFLPVQTLIAPRFSFLSFLLPMSTDSGEDEQRLAAALRAEIIACIPAQSLDALGQGLTVDLAYRVQDELTSLREAEGDSVIGYKIGCTSPAIRTALSIQESVFGRLWASEQRLSGVQLCAKQFKGLAIEGELGLTLISTEGPPATWTVEYMPVIELHHGEFDCRVQHRAAELIAKNAIHAGVVRAFRGTRCALADIPLDVPIVVTVDGIVREQPVLRTLELGGNVGPLGTITWLSQRLEQSASGTLSAGSFVLAATPGSLMPVQDTATVKVQFGELEVECSVQPFADLSA
jgi:2-keto-4-pentenoate hydratase